MTDNKPSPRFTFYTGHDKPEHQMQHFTVTAHGEVLEPSQDHQSMAGPATLEMQVWADDEANAAEIYRQIGQHLGFKSGDNLTIAKSVASTPTTGRPSAYNPKFTATS